MCPLFRINKTWKTDESVQLKYELSYFSTKTYVVGT